MTASCIYEGTIRHRRYAVRRREFVHRIALAYVDLDELPQLLGGRLVRRRPGLLRFRRADYLGDASTALGACVRETVEAGCGVAPDGPISVLTQFRSFGHCFNPVSFYFCHSVDGGLDAAVAEVTNTPWGERHAYVVPGRAGATVLHGRFSKELHVSPFMEMDHKYTMRLAVPGPTLSVHIENHRAGELQFDATLALRRVELTPASAARLVARYPAATARVLGLIYLHGLRLKLRGVPMHPHPGGQEV
jgi:uncharacterized protein